MGKTKLQLEEEIKSLKQQIEVQSKAEEHDKSAEEIKDVYDAYIRAGFTESQAWEIFMAQVSGASRPKRTLF